MLDVLIVGGTLVDGTGAPGRVVNVGIKDAKIAAITEDVPDAARVVDATGMVVAPGFVDVHTHYDAQAFWDPYLTPSPLHGVTTVFGGNCGFTIAPVNTEQSDYLMRMMARVEGMPLEALAEGVGWNWGSFAEYLDLLDGTLAINAGFLVGHSAIRRVVMGEDATAEEATSEQIAQMVQLAHDSMSAGALGFSSSLARTHNDAEGKPVPSRHAAHDEIVALAGAVRDHEGTTLEFLPAIGPFPEEIIDLMCRMSLAANRPLNWNLLGVSSMNPTGHEVQLRASDVAAERGAKIVALTLPQVMHLRVNLRSGFVLDALPGWPEVFKIPVTERMEALRDPEVRRRMKEGASSKEAGSFRALANWAQMRIAETFAPENEGLAGRMVGEIATERGQDPFDCLIDISLADDLNTGFMLPTFGDDDESWKLRAQVWRDERTVIGGSDAGAHLDMQCTAGYATTMLATAVRERQLLSVEEAIRLITDVPARLYGLRNRGRIAEGWAADITVFDLSRVATNATHTRFDLPGGASRLYADATGIEHVFVNGVEIVTADALTGAKPGTLLRSGIDTETVTVPGG